MLGNISKKKGDNGDFYTKPVIDKKLKDAETATKAYTDKAAADAKNDLYAEVGEKVGAVEETVKARLDSTDTKLDTKVDKVSGKSLIDSDVADNLKYDTDKEEILIKVSEPSQGLRVKSTAFSESTKIESGGITIESDASGLGNYLSLSPFGGIMINTPTTSNADIRLVTPKGTHKISEKANTSDVFLKSGDVVLAKGKIIKVTKDGESTAYDGSTENIQIRGDAMFIRANDVEPYGLMLSKNGIVLDTDDNENVNIKSGEITVYKKDSTGNSVAHKLTEKMSVSDLESYLLNGGQKSIIGDLYVNGGESSTNDITLWRVEKNGPVTHKLSEKANMSNSSGGFAAGEGAYAYGTKEVASGEIGLLGMTDLNAIQLGTGTNGQEFSVQVYDYVLVVSGEERGKKSATDGKKYIKDVGKLSDLATADKSSIVAAINEVKSSGGGDVLGNLTYDGTNDIINSSANLLLENSASVAAYNGTFRGDIKIGQLGANKWAYTISPTTGFSTSVDVTCTSGNKVHSLANKADKTDVLTKTNTAAFTPTGDYQPATKKYVDDAIAALKAELGLE